MYISGFIEIYPGLWYEETTGFPWTTRSCRYEGCVEWHYEGQLRPLMKRHHRGYAEAYIDKKCVSWHRVVYEYFKGKIPNAMHVDHINNDPNDNRIENLQLLSHRSNCRKQKIPKSNTSGYMGVSESGSKYKASIELNQKHIYIGTYASPEEAYRSYIIAKMKYHGEESINPLKNLPSWKPEYDSLTHRN
jgi:hypothetical protein